VPVVRVVEWSLVFVRHFRVVGVDHVRRSTVGFTNAAGLLLLLDGRRRVPTTSLLGLFSSASAAAVSAAAVDREQRRRLLMLRSGQHGQERPDGRQ